MTYPRELLIIDIYEKKFARCCALALLDIFTAVFIWVDHSRGKWPFAPTRFLLVKMWFINLKTAV